jgi:hypothetical protein
MNNHFLFNKPKTVVFHKCLTDFFDKISSMHIGNTILIDHNLVRMMRSPIDNVTLVEKWNRRVEVFSKYLMWGSPPLLGIISFHKWVRVYIGGTQFFWYDMIEHVANTKFQRHLNPYSDHGNSSFYNMRPKIYSKLKWNFWDLSTSYLRICFKIFNLVLWWKCCMEGLQWYNVLFRIVLSILSTIPQNLFRPIML